MASIRDAGGAEAQALAAIADFDGKRVLEIGCGDGRLTWLYADRAGSVLGVDPDEALIEEARNATPAELEGRVRFEAGTVEDLSRTAVFDAAFLSWSL